MCCKLHDLNDFIHNQSIVPFVVGIVETWFNNLIPDSCLNVPNYSILRFDRLTRGGGIMLLIRDNFRILHSKCMSFGPIQLLYADIECALHVNNVTRFVCVYRPS